MKPPDVYSMRDFLIRLLFYPSDSHNLEMITEIHTRRDLSNFLNDEDFSKFARLSASLRHGFPKKWQLERFNIDPEAIDTPDVWRLLALFLTSDLSDNSNEDRPRRPSQDFNKRSFFFGGGATFSDLRLRVGANGDTSTHTHKID